LRGHVFSVLFWGKKKFKEVWGRRGKKYSKISPSKKKKEKR